MSHIEDPNEVPAIHLLDKAPEKPVGAPTVAVCFCGAGPHATLDGKCAKGHNVKGNQNTRKHAQRNPTRVEEILAENIAEYNPTTLKAKRACQILSNIEERLERVKDGTPEHGRLIDKWTMLTALLVESRAQAGTALDADVTQMTDDEQIAAATEILTSLLTARDERVKSAALTQAATAHAGGPSEAVAEPEGDAANPTSPPAPEVICEFCHQSLKRCKEIEDRYIDSWRALHFLDPAEVQRRNDLLTDEMYLSMTGKPRQKSGGAKGGATW